MFRHLALLLAVLSVGSLGQSKEYLIKLKPEAFVQSFIQFQGLSVGDQHEPGRLIKVNIDKDIPIVLAQLLALPEVEHVVPNITLRTFRKPMTSMVSLKEQWALDKIKASEAWKLAKNKGSSKVIVAVIDTGVDYNHESLKANMVPGYDFRDNDDDPMDETSARNPGHGTHCAGVIGATGVVDGGISGIAPNISVMPIRFLGSDGSGDLMGGVKSIDFAIEKGAQVISASWGATVPRSQATDLIAAVKRASDAGVLFVAAASNDGANNDKTGVYPANATFENTISVAASGSRDERPQWSNYGRAKVHLASPGLNIMSTLPKNKYGNLSGTSMATPLVAGLAALLKSQRPSITGSEILAVLQNTGAKVEIETACNCRIDAQAAMKAVLENKKLIVPQAGSIEPDTERQFSIFNGENDAYSFESSDETVASITSDGLLKAAAEGEFVITAKDKSGQEIKTLKMFVTKTSEGGGGSPIPGGECPFDNPQICDAICQIAPSLPWCNK